MKKTTAIPTPAVEYDGYYLIDVIARSGFCLTIPARGYNLKSWLNFERGLGSTAEYRAVSEKEWMKLHWTQTPLAEDTDEAKPPKKIVKKAVKKAAKQQVKPAKKAAKKATPKKVPAKK